MAKKKKAKSDAKDPKSDAKSEAESGSAQAVAAPTTPAEAAFRKGNYAAVHLLAKSGDESAKKLLPLTTIDMGQVACGVVALAVVITIAIFTIGH